MLYSHLNHSLLFNRFFYLHPNSFNFIIILPETNIIAISLLKSIAIEKRHNTRVKLTPWRLSHCNIKLLVPLLHPINTRQTPNKTIYSTPNHDSSSKESNQTKPPENISTIKHLRELIFKSKEA